MEFTIHNQVLLLVFVTAMVMGAVVNKTNFCTMGAVSDWVNMGDTGRMRAWLFAIGVAMGGVLILEGSGVISLSGGTFPPYRTATFAWIRYLLGGVMFGIGMTLGSGCGQKTLVRVGSGNLKSLLVLAVGFVSAYLMLWTSFFSDVFLGWMQPTFIDLASRGISSQEVGDILGGLFGSEENSTLHLVIGAAAAAGLLFVAFRASEFRGNRDNILGGAVVGLAVLVGWYVTAGSMGQEWKEYAEFAEDIPSRVQAQSYTFISPMGDSVRYLLQPGNLSLVNFGIMALTGVIVGSFLYSLVTRKFRVEWFTSLGDAVRHIIGGALMGIGGVLAMGCTIGQGVTGVSTLALGSMLAFVSIVFGCAITMKVQYYKMVYESEASFTAALVSALVDMRLLPKGLRRLEAV